MLRLYCCDVAVNSTNQQCCNKRTNNFPLHCCRFTEHLVPLPTTHKRAGLKVPDIVAIFAKYVQFFARVSWRSTRSNFTKILPVTAAMIHADKRPARHEEATGRFSLFTRTRKKKKLYVLPTQLYLCVLCGSENKRRLFPYTKLTDWFL